MDKNLLKTCLDEIEHHKGMLMAENEISDVELKELEYIKYALERENEVDTIIILNAVCSITNSSDLHDYVMYLLELIHNNDDISIKNTCKWLKHEVSKNGVVGSLSKFSFQPFNEFLQCLKENDEVGEEDIEFAEGFVNDANYVIRASLFDGDFTGVELFVNISPSSDDIKTFNDRTDKRYMKQQKKKLLNG
ncbi:hypothetical protein DA469_21705 [Bacillus subtilis]|nr:hypothetical protein DA469_21705 [Bacillus subtilis]